MSRTGLDGATLANSLRAMAGDGSIEWVSEPIQASVLLDIADMLEEYESVQGESDYWKHEALRRICTEGELLRVRTARRKDRSENEQLCNENAKLRELVQDFDKCLTEAERLAYIQGHMTIYDGTLLDSLHPRMRELGIEVGG